MRGVVLVPGRRQDVLWLDYLGSEGTLAMNWAYFDDLWLTSPENPGAFENLGGDFRSPPAAVAIGIDRLEVFGLGADYALYHKTYIVQNDVGSWTDEWENLGGDLTSTPVVVSTAADRLDIFVLGPDQGLLHRRRTGLAWSAWEELGGCFTSAPVVLPDGPDTFDIFARGPDYLIYKARLTAVGLTDWAALGGGLLREPLAASAPAAVRVRDELYVFVVAADLAMWFTRFDGKLWKPWSSLGGRFVSEPVAIALFPEIDQGTGAGRIDVFGVEAGDQFLLHNWLELDRSKQVGVAGLTTAGETSFYQTDDWHGWVADSDVQEDLPRGRYMCAPGISAPFPAPTPVEMPPIVFYLVQPDTDGTIHQRGFEDGVWGRNDSGPTYLLPSTFVFGIDEIDITSTRSNGSDTDHAVVTFGVGGRVPQSRYFGLGDLNSGDYDYRGVDGTSPYEMGAATVELCEPAAVSWSIVNSNNHDNYAFIASTLARAGEDVVNDYLKADLFKGVLAFGIEAINPFGSLVGVLVAVLIIEPALKFIFTSCDGIVAVGALSYPSGRVLQEAVLETPDLTLRGSMSYVGDDPGQPCGAPHYTVDWSIRLSGGPF